MWICLSLCEVCCGTSDNGEVGLSKPKLFHCFSIGVVFWRVIDLNTLCFCRNGVWSRKLLLSLSSWEFLLLIPIVDCWRVIPNFSWISAAVYHSVMSSDGFFSRKVPIDMFFAPKSLATILRLRPFFTIGYLIESRIRNAIFILHLLWGVEIRYGFLCVRHGI